MANLYKNRIPIRNIYYMLSYAYDFIENGELNKYGDEKFDNMFEMLSLLLIKGFNSQIKTGLYKEYTDTNDDLLYIKGKINITKTISNSLRGKNTINCDYEEYSINNIFNQIIKSTFLLLKKKKLSDNIYKKIDGCLNYLIQVDTIKLDNSFSWDSIIYNRNNKMYKMLIDICYLINDSLLINEDNGKNVANIYFDENKLAKLYEKFIFEFYKKEVPDCIVSYQKKFNYQDITGNIVDFIPSLFTDILITKGGITLIIDAKFYQNTLNSNEFFTKDKLHSTHMAQLYTYMNNIPLNNTISGMLLYPTVSYEFNKYGTIQGKKIYVNTINLNENFETIKEKMLNIIFEVFK